MALRICGRILGKVRPPHPGFLEIVEQGNGIEGRDLTSGKDLSEEFGNDDSKNVSGDLQIASSSSSSPLLSQSELACTRALDAIDNRQSREHDMLSKIACEINIKTLQPDVMIGLLDAYARSNCLVPFLFKDAVDPITKHLFNNSSPPADLSDICKVARAYSRQKLRHNELFLRIRMYVESVVFSSGSLVSSCLLSFASLRLPLPNLKFGSSGKNPINILELGCKGEEVDLEFDSRAEICHALLLNSLMSPSRDVVDPRILHHVSKMSSDASKMFSKTTSSSSGVSMPVSEVFFPGSEVLDYSLTYKTHRYLLILRSAFRYLYPVCFQNLGKMEKDLFRLAHMKEFSNDKKKKSGFVEKLSWILKKLKIAHTTYVKRGPFFFDILERDRKVVYQCNHWDRFYAPVSSSFSSSSSVFGSSGNEKIAEKCLEERIIKAMGYRVVQLPHWQWNKLKVKRQRIEYVRMSRYYAIRDRREFEARDEELPFLGEYFFDKDRPKQPWAWNQHKEYDVHDPKNHHLPSSSLR